MSDAKPSAEETIEDFVNSIDDILDFVNASKKRALHDTQIKVIIKNKIQRIKGTYNNLSSHTTMDSELRSKAFFDAIPKMINVLNSIDHEGVFELIWLEINAMINSFATSLIGTHSKGDVWSVQGSATLLVQIISGIPKVQHLPTLSDRSPDDPEYLDRWIVTFNCLQFNAATFFTVIYAVKTVQLSDLIYWSNQAFFYFSLLEEFFRIFEWETIARVMKNRPQIFFANIFAFSVIFQSLVDHVFLLNRRFGMSWPTEIDTHGLLESSSFDDILKLIAHVRQHPKTALEKLNELFKTGLWSLNDNPMQAGPVKNLFDLDMIYDYYESYVQSLKFGKAFFEHSKTENDNLPQITKAIELNNWVLSYFENQVGDRKILLESYLGSQYVDILDQQLELIALECIFSNSIMPYSTHFKQIGWLFQDADPLQFSDVFLRKLFVELFLSTMIEPIIPFDDLLNEIKRLRSLLTFKPRDVTALIILEVILSVALKKREVPTKDEVFIIVNKNGIVSGGDYHLYDQFQDYIEFLLLSFQGGPSFMSEQLLTRKNINPFDSMTWLIPVFNKPFKDRFKIPIHYLPFNRSCDGIINNS